MKEKPSLTTNESPAGEEARVFADRTESLFRQQLELGYRETDRLFAGLLLLEWAVLAVIALVVDRVAGHGVFEKSDPWVWPIVFAGAIITIGAVWLARAWPGRALTRYTIAAVQMLQCGLLISLSGGAVEAHFPVFCSLVILSFYRDWRVLVPATLVALAGDIPSVPLWPHAFSGLFASNGGGSLEGCAGMIAIDFILALFCLRSTREMRATATRTAALEASEHGFRQIFEKAPIGMAVVGMDERYRETNAAFCRMLGFEPDELRARTPFDVTHPHDMKATRQTSSILLQSNESHRIEKRYLCKNGEILWAMRTSCLIRDDSGRPLHFLTMVEDITDWKAAQEALRRQTDRLAGSQHANQLIMDNSRDVICSLDAHGVFLSTNVACERLWGYAAEELIGRNYLVVVHPEDRLSSRQMEESTRSGAKVTDFVNRCLRKDGSIVDVLWSASWSDEEEMLFCVARDVTEQQRIERELREAKETADRANRAKSEFLSRMSHELRTPLNAILGFGQLLERQDPRPAQRPHLHYILNAGHHLLKLINEVLDISRIETDRMQVSIEPVSVEEALREAIDLIKPLANEHRVHLFTPPEEDMALFVLADRQRLKQVLLNLLNNGVKYTPESGAVMLQCTALEDRVRIAIHDTGPGIAPDKLERVFTPFDRLGAEQSGVEGTGLGLALSQRLIRAMRGQIGVESKPDEGATFWFELSRAASPLHGVEGEERASQAGIPEFSEEGGLLAVAE
jgi:PAS domain S-box-containing protein